MRKEEDEILLLLLSAIIYSDFYFFFIAIKINCKKKGELYRLYINLMINIRMKI
jgi:hypothetical protein